MNDKDRIVKVTANKLRAKEKRKSSPLATRTFEQNICSQKESSIIINHFLGATFIKVEA